MRILLHLTVAYLLSQTHVAAQSQNSTGVVPIEAQVDLRRYQFAEPLDSSDFQRFIRSLRADDGPPDVGGTPKRYRQVWMVSEHGGLSMVSRGNGEVITLEAERPIVDIFENSFLNMLTSDGRSCIARFWERPCAMLCRTTTYYVEE